LQTAFESGNTTDIREWMWAHRLSANSSAAVKPAQNAGGVRYFDVNRTGHVSRFSGHVHHEKRSS
jgi:hypothetical protein